MFYVCPRNQKTKQMSPKAQSLFSELLDVNLELEKNYSGSLAMRYLELTEAIKEEMGEHEYKSFITLGRQMFAPKTSN